MECVDVCFTSNSLLSPISRVKAKRTSPDPPEFYLLDFNVYSSTFLTSPVPYPLCITVTQVRGINKRTWRESCISMPISSCDQEPSIFYPYFIIPFIMKSSTLFSSLISLVNVVSAATITYNWDATLVQANPDSRLSRPVVGINNKWPCPTITGKQELNPCKKQRPYAYTFVQVTWATQ